MRSEHAIPRSCLGNNGLSSGVIRTLAIAPPWGWLRAGIHVLKQGDQFFDIPEKPRLFRLKMRNLPPESGHTRLIEIIVAHRGFSMHSACLMAQKILRFGCFSIVVVVRTVVRTR
jgi:hypothetical protein